MRQRRPSTSWTLDGPAEIDDELGAHSSMDTTNGHHHDNQVAISRLRIESNDRARRNMRNHLTDRNSNLNANMNLNQISILKWSLILTICCHLISITSAQFLFTYEINQEDDSRAPKSSLFDPSAFKIVTPSQLQSSYQKISSQLDSQVASGQVPSSTAANSDLFTVAPLPPVPQTQSAPVAPTPSAALGPQQPQSFLKQTTQALQSFAELFNFGSQPSTNPQQPQSPVSSPSPLGSGPASLSIDQQAEARSLHEHWLAQQQKSHPVNSAPAASPPSALQSFTTSLPTNSLLQQQQQQLQLQQQQQQQQPQPQLQQHQQQATGGQDAPPGSYWLTANPLNGPDGNFLVEIKQPNEQNQQQQQQQQPAQQLAPSGPSVTPSSLVDNLLALGQQRASGERPSPLPVQAQSIAGRPVPRSQQQSAQSSFLSTPTSYYPMPTGSEGGISQVAPQQQTQTGSSTQQQRFNSFIQSQAPQTPVTQPTISRPIGPTFHLAQRQQQLAQQRAQAAAAAAQAPRIEDQESSSQLLQPPANAPENFVAPHIGNNHLLGHHHQARDQRTQPQQPHLKSAEESLNAFRQQQQQQHQQQNGLFAASQQLVNQQQQQQQQQQQHHRERQQHHSVEPPVNRQPQRLSEPANAPIERPQHHNTQHQTFTMQRDPSPESQPLQHSTLGEIPKVSPQIYESFLLQQRDQHEKHMELLKQQQELNKLLEQKQKQEDNEARRKRKKEELDREAKAKRQRELEEQLQARRQKQEQEERQRRRQLQLEREEAEKKRQAEEARRYREYLELRERERREEEAKKERELAEAKRRKAEAEERELKAKMERELVERRRLEAERIAAEEAELKRQRDEEVKYANYLRQQEELKKFMELKAKEDEAIQNQRRQRLRQQEQQQQQVANQRVAVATQDAAATAQQLRNDEAARANRLAAQHRERAQAQSQRVGTFGARGRALAPATLPQTTSTTTTSTTTQAPLPLSNNDYASDPQPSERLSGTLSSTSGESGSTNLLPESIVADEPAPTPTTQTTPIARTVPTSSRSRSQQVAAAQRRQRTQALDEKLIRQKIPLYSGAGKYGLYRNESLSQDLAALLASVTLPPSTSTTTTSTTTTTTTTTTTPAPEVASDHSSSPSASTTTGSSRSQQSRRTGLRGPLVGFPNASEQIFDDDVPRRPARGLVTGASRAVTAAASAVLASTSSASGSSRVIPRPPVTVQPTATPLPTTTTSRLRSSSESSPNTQKATARIGLGSLPPDSDNDGIPGRAGVEYPVLAAVPPTSFSCSKQPLNGYYADTETACQVVHLCQGGAQSSILCPNGTIFNQEKFSCQWWYEVNCSRAPNFYQLNDNLYKGQLGDPLAAPSSSDDDISPADSRVGGASTSIATMTPSSTSSPSTTATSATPPATSGSVGDTPLKVKRIVRLRGDQKRQHLVQDKSEASGNLL